jgi:flavin-dependent dehydrogenase
MIDLIVAGGGPAGLATSVNAARAGMSVVVVEPREFPVDKACGEGIMPSGVSALRRLGVDITGRPLHGITYTNQRHAVSAEFHRGLGAGLRRTTLHALLAARATELGVRVVPGRVDADDVRQSADDVRAGGFRARWLVAADGLRSPLRRALGLRLPEAGVRRYGLRRHYGITPWTDHVEVHLSDDAEAYVTPLGDNLLGVALLGSRRVDYQTALAGFPELRDRLGDTAVTPVRGAGPLRQRVSRRTAGRVLLVGDAAGYVDALTGEGVALALRCAEALVQRLMTNQLPDYERDFRAISRRHVVLTEALMRARSRESTARLIVPAAARLPGVFRRVVDMLA